MKINRINNIFVVGNRNNQQQKIKSTVQKENTYQTVPVSVANLKANFMPLSFKSSQTDFNTFINLLSDTVVFNNSLLRQIDDFSFQYNPDFKTVDWTEFVYQMDEDVVEFASGNTISFLEMLLLDNSFSDLLNSKEFNPRKAIEFFDEYFANEISASGVFPFEHVMSYMLDFAKSDRNANDYVQDLTYFGTLVDKNGKRIFSDENGDMKKYHLNAIKHFLNVDKSSVEASNTQMLLDLVCSNVLGKHVFDDLPPYGKINALIVDDIDKLYQAYICGINPIDVFVPTFKTEENALQTLSVGDVYELDGIKNIFILDKNKKSVQLDIDKKTYFKLFPPVERFAVTQNDIGNCWEVLAINTLLSEASERSKILSLFHQDGDDIIVAFPNSKNKVKFINCELPDNTQEKFYSRDSLGVRLLEYAEGKELYLKKLQSIYEKSDIQDNFKIAFLLNYAIFKKNNNVDLFDIVRNGQAYSFIPWEESANSKYYDTPYSKCRDGGHPKTLYKLLGYESDDIEIFQEECFWKISEGAFFDENIVTLATIDEDILPDEKEEKIHKNHVYRILPNKIDENGRVEDFKLLDPHSIVEMICDYSEIRKYGSTIYVTKKSL